MRTVGLTHVGNVRTTNEDTFLIECAKKPCFMLVADGMGGHAAGDVASSTAAGCIKSYIEDIGTETLDEEQIRAAVVYANDCLVEEMKNNEQLRGMGTTLTFAYIDGEDITLAQVGDSGAFLFNSQLQKITKDHTYVQHLIDSGVIKDDAVEEYPFRNIITRALGMKKLEIDLYHIQWKKGDTLLLCSDGLTTYVGEQAIVQALGGAGQLQEKAQHLLDLALEAGGKDNITVIIAENSLQEDVTK